MLFAAHLLLGKQRQMGYVTKVENLIKKWTSQQVFFFFFFSFSKNDAGRWGAEHKHLLFYCVLKWLFSRKVMDTLLGLGEDVWALPEREDRAFSVTSCGWPD